LPNLARFGHSAHQPILTNHKSIIKKKLPLGCKMEPFSEEINRFQTYCLLEKLEKQGIISAQGSGKGTKYILKSA
jgi:hypothetical protein